MFVESGKEVNIVAEGYNFNITYTDDKPNVHITLHGDKNIRKAPPLPILHLPKDCTVSFDYCFEHCQSLVDIENLRDWNTSNAISFHGMFKDCIQLRNIEPIYKWDTHNVTDMSHMFSGCRELTIPWGNWIPWNTGNVTNMGYMFYGTLLKDETTNWIKYWDLSKLTNIYAMFGYTYANYCVIAMTLPKAVSGQLIFYSSRTPPTNPVKYINYWEAEGEPSEIIRVNREHPELPPGIDTWYDVPV